MYGFLYGMLFASLTINYVIKSGYKNFTKILLAIFAGFLMMYFIGICHLSYFIGIQKVFISSFLLLIYGELLKVILATILIYILMLKFNKN